MLRWIWWDCWSRACITLFPRYLFRTCATMELHLGFGRYLVRMGWFLFYFFTDCSWCSRTVIFCRRLCYSSCWWCCSWVWMILVLLCIVGFGLICFGVSVRVVSTITWDGTGWGSCFTRIIRAGWADAGWCSQDDHRYGTGFGWCCHGRGRLGYKYCPPECMVGRYLRENLL